MNGEYLDTQLRFNILDEEFIEVQHHVYPIPFNDNLGKELVVLYNFDEIKNGKTWYTDSNGLETQKRVLNYRPTYDLDLMQPISGNYYVVNMFTYMEDQQSGRRVAILTDRSCGCSSLLEGQMEIMVHRRLARDDGKGLMEALNERNQYN